MNPISSFLDGREAELPNIATLIQMLGDSSPELELQHHAQYSDHGNEPIKNLEAIDAELPSVGNLLVTPPKFPIK